jgi:AraC-like DNA-binding protein
MNENKIHIKNMVCQRCILAVQDILHDLNIEAEEVALGKVTLTHELDADKRKELSDRLKDLDFELLEPGRSSLISRIKTLIVEQIHHSKEPLKENFSTFLADKLHHEYSYLSRLFSSVEGITIEKYIARQKIEKVKELLFYDELSLSEIAFQMDYSSAAYLSTQFKKETGMTPTEFKNRHQPGHQHLDSL